MWNIRVTPRPTAAAAVALAFLGLDQPALEALGSRALLLVMVVAVGLAGPVAMVRRVACTGEQEEVVAVPAAKALSASSGVLVVAIRQMRQTFNFNFNFN